MAMTDPIEATNVEQFPHTQEHKRLLALRSLGLLDTPSSDSFDRITRLASQIFDLPIAAVSLTDEDRQWFKSRVGLTETEMPRDTAPTTIPPKRDDGDLLREPTVDGQDDVFELLGSRSDPCFRG